MLESRPYYCSGHSTFSGLSPLPDAVRNPTGVTVCEPLANRCPGTRISQLWKWVHIRGVIDAHTSCSPHPSHLIAWESESLSEGSCYKTTHLLRGIRRHPFESSDSFLQAPCHTVMCLPIMLIILLINLFFLTVHLSVPSGLTTWDLSVGIFKIQKAIIVLVLITK